MKLKEMEYTVVFIPNEKELKELLVIYDKAGWCWIGSTRASDYVSYVKTECKYPVRVTINNNFGTYCMNGNKELTLEEFRKEQGIMKYSEGDVLENKSQIFTVEAIIGRIYIGINEDDEAEILTECEASIYTLRQKITKTNMTVSEIENALGKAAGSLNVVAE